MFELLQPLSRMALINQAVKSGSKLFTCVISPQMSWFDKNHLDEKRSHAYPFFLGMWAEQLLQDIQAAKWIEEFNSTLDQEDPMYEQKVLSYADPVIREKIKRSQDIERYLTRVTMTFCYVIKDSYYHGLVKIDSPMQTQISVRVSDQRHLVIEPDLVRLMSRADGTVFHEWRPAQDINGSGKYVWMDTKALITTTYNVRSRFCPVYMGDVINAWSRLYAETYDRAAERFSLTAEQLIAKAGHVRLLEQMLRAPRDGIKARRIQRMMVLPAFAHHYTRCADRLIGLLSLENGFTEYEDFSAAADSIHRQMVNMLINSIDAMSNPMVYMENLDSSDQVIRQMPE